MVLLVTCTNSGLASKVRIAHFHPVNVPPDGPAADLAFELPSPTGRILFFAEQRASQPRLQTAGEWDSVDERVQWKEAAAIRRVERVQQLATHWHFNALRKTPHSQELMHHIIQLNLRHSQTVAKPD